MPEAEEMDRLIEEGGFSMSNIDKYYGKDVCDKNFKPAFSMPYGSPEIFDGVGKS